MVNFRESRELRKIKFEMGLYKLDYDINQIWFDIEHSDNSKVIYGHLERIQDLIETHRELMWAGIELDISYDQKFMETLEGILFDKYCELIGC